VCLIGDFRAQPPTPDATESLVRVLAWLAGRDGVDPAPGATSSFTSRGSNRWPAGTVVETTTIAGHREMSQTACPGDAAFALVKGELPGRVAARLQATAAPATTAPATTTTASPATATATTTSAMASTTTRDEALVAARGRGDGGGFPVVPVAGGGGVLAAALGAIIARRNRLARHR